MTFVLVIALLIVGAYAAFITYKCIILNEMVENLGESVETSLDVLDACYSDLSVAASTPVFSDEPVVRNVVAAIRRSREAVHMIAVQLISFDEKAEE